MTVKSTRSAQHVRIINRKKPSSDLKKNNGRKWWGGGRGGGGKGGKEHTSNCSLGKIKIRHYCQCAVNTCNL